MNSRKLSIIYISIEAVLLTILMVLLFVLLSQGRYIDDKSAPLWPFVGAMKVSLTAVSLLTVIVGRILFRKKKWAVIDLFGIYFLLTVTADVFFSFGNINWVPHLLFLCTYFIFLFIRRGKWFEVFIPLGVGLVAFLVLYLAAKMDPLMACIDSLLGATLIYNCVCCWIRYGKGKERFFLIFAIAVTLILVSDLTVAITGKMRHPMWLNNVIGLFNWPLYASGNVLFVTHYLRLKEEEAAF